MELCVECENEFIVFGETTIQIGKKEFSLKAKHCTKCDNVQLSPKNIEEINVWGNALTTTVAEFQPYFSDKLVETSEFYANTFGLKWAEFIKICTAFYLFEMTKDKGFKKARTTLLSDSQNLFAGNKAKKSVPVRYRLFKQIQLFAEAWDIHEPNVIEEAILCCATLLESNKTHGTIRAVEKRAQLEQFVSNYAAAA